MKLRFLVLVLIGLMATSTFAATIGAWIQDPYPDAEGTCSGNWTNPNMWKASSNGQPPIPTTNTGDEIKINGSNIQSTKGGVVATINTFVGGTDGVTNYNCKLTIAGGTNAYEASTLKIEGGSIGVAQFQVGHGSSTDKGQWGVVEQSGGTVSAEKLIIGYYGTRGKAIGSYTISDGILQGNSGISGGTDRLLVGTGYTTGSTTANNEGTFTVQGKLADISMKQLYVGGYSTYVGTGNIVFQASPDGISPITVSDSINLSAAGIANLTVSKGGSTGDLVLIVNTGASAVSGVFDSLNGVVGGADEGDTVMLGDTSYTVTYVYNASTGAHTGGNDIALIPEPATIALLGLGLIAIRRKK